MADQGNDMPGGLEGLRVVDQAVGRAFDNIFTTQGRRGVNARAAQHLTTGPIQTAALHHRPSYRWAHYTPENIERKLAEEDKDESTREQPAKKKRKVNPSSESQDVVHFTTKPESQGARDWTFPAEVWLNILEFAGLHTMVVAENIHPSLKAMLSDRENVWSNCKLREYGEDAPNLPVGMTERQFAILVAGRGCQQPDCPRQDTVKVFWAFQKRVCADCFRSQTTRYNELPDTFQNDPIRVELLDHIQAGIINGGKYRASRKAKDDVDEWERISQNKLVFSKRDIANIDHYCESAVRLGKTPDEIRNEFDISINHAIRLARSLEKIEVWETTNKNAPRHRNARKLFFKNEATKLQPPISSEAIERMQPFHKALDSNRAPTMEQWEVLKPKLSPLKQEADRIVDIDRITSDQLYGVHIDQRIDTYTALHARRSLGNSTEQITVLTFARQQLQGLQARQIAHVDQVPMLLKSVKMQWSPDVVDGMLIDGTIGPYELTLDDAKAVFNMFKQLSQNTLDSRQMADTFDKFRCPACPRNDKVKRYKFEELFDHLHAKHTRFASDYSIKMRQPFAKTTGHRFPWYTVPWPENLPILADHQSPSSTTDALVWDFDTRQSYIEAPVVATTSAYHGRIVVPPPAPANADFAASALYAGQKLHSTALPSPIQTALAIQFGIDCYASAHGVGSTPPLADLVRASEFLTKSSADHKLAFRFPCGFCTANGGIPRTSQWVKTSRTFKDLVQHFNNVHVNNGDEEEDGGDNEWVDGIFALPNDKETRTILDNADRDLVKRKRDEATKQKKRREDKRKTVSEKGDVVLRTPLAWDVFGELWKVVEGEE